MHGFVLTGFSEPHIWQMSCLNGCLLRQIMQVHLSLLLAVRDDVGEGGVFCEVLLLLVVWVSTCRGWDVEAVVRGDRIV